MAVMRPLALLLIIGAAVSCSSRHPDAAPVPPADATSTTSPQASSSPLPRVTPTAASRSRRTPPMQRRHPGRAHATGSLALHWAALRQCESSDNYRSIDPPLYGAYQFTLSTWRSVGGAGNPADASPTEQDRRAQLLYKRDGRRPWPVCGRRL